MRRRFFAVSGLLLAAAGYGAFGGPAGAAVELPEATIYLSSSSAGLVDGTRFTSGDILSYDGGADQWTMVFDASAAGLGGANVDGFHIVDADPAASIIHMSFAGVATVPGVGRVDDSDVVTFTGTTGAATAGTFSEHINGSDVGLTSGGEDLDALTAIGGDFAVSVLGSASVPRAGGGTLRAVDEDLMRFSGTFDSPTTGDFSLLFDGSDTGFRGDLVGSWIDPDTNEIYGAALGNFTVDGLSGDGDDVFRFTGTTGDPTSGTFIRFFDGDAHRFGGEQIDGLHLVPGPPGDPGQADLGITIEDDVASGALAGDLISFAVEVTNAGPDAADNVVVTGNLPAGLVFESTIGCAQDPDGLPCSLGSLPAGQTTSFTLRATVGPEVLGPITTSVSVTAGAADGVPGNDTASVETLISGPPQANDDGPSTNSVPGDPYHGPIGGTVTVPAPGLLSNDVLGSPPGTVLSFGGEDAGGTAGDHAAGETAEIGDGSLSVNADGSFDFTAPAGAAGPFAFRYRVANEGGSSEAVVTVYLGDRPSLAGGDLVYLSTAGRGTVDGLSFDDEDIVVYDMAADTWAMVFDGSDVGFGTADIDGFHIESIEPEAVIHLSLTAPRTIPGITGTVDDSDIFTFTGSSIGSETAGTFTLLVDGSDMNLSSGGEDIDAIGSIGDDVVLSTLGSFNVGGGLTGGDEDLLNLAVDSTGSTTTGILTMLFDGSDVDLRAEDVIGASVDPAEGDIYASVFGPFAVPGLSGDGDDVITFTGTTGSTTAGTYSTFFDGDAHRFGGHQIDGLHVTRGGEPPTGLGTLTDPSYGEGWHLEPPELIFDGDGQTATVRLVQYGPDGEPTGATPPSGISLTRPNPLFTVTETSAGVFEVGGSATIGSELIGLTIPGQSGRELLWVTSIRVLSDVTIVSGSDVVFPSPGDSEVSSVEPFELSELEARFHAGSETTNATIPYIIRGNAPAVGTKLSGISIYGQVVEPPGLPSIERSGLTLITLEVLPVTEIFREAVIDVDYEALGAAGLATGQNASTAAVEDGSIGTLANETAPPETVPADGGCQAAVNAGVGQNVVNYNNTVGLVGELRGVITPGPNEGDSGTLASLIFLAGLRGKASLFFEGNVQLSGTFKYECELFKFPTFAIPVPGPWVGVFDVIVDTKVIAGAETSIVATDFGFTYKAGCEVDIDSKAGVTYTATGGFQPVNQLAAPTLNCSDSGITVGQGTGAGEIGIKFHGSVVAEAGFWVGGKLTAALARLLRSPDLGKFRPFVAQAGPSLDITVENGANVIKNKGHKTGIAQNLNLGEIGLNGADLENALKYFGVSVSIPLPKLPAATLSLPALAGPPTASTLTYEVDGVAQTGSDARKVNVDEMLVVTVTKPSFQPFSLDLHDEFFVYETTTGTPVLDSFFAFSKVGDQAVTEMVMSADLCANEFSDARTFRVHGYLKVLEIGRAIPVYLGEFTVHCDRDLSFEVSQHGSANLGDPEIVTSIKLHPGKTTATVFMRQEGMDDENWHVDDVTGRAAPFLTISPATGTFASGTVTLELELDCETADSDHATTRFQATVSGRLEPAELVVTYDCSPNWIEVRPDNTRLFAEINIRSEGMFLDRWDATARTTPPINQLWDTLPAEELYSNASTKAIDPRPQPRCGEFQGGQRVELTIQTRTRGSDSILVLLPQRDPPPREPGNTDGEPEECDEEDDGGGDDEDGDDDQDDNGPPTGPAGPSGDPHMTSFDGVRYDAQVLGEYEYASSADGHIRLVGRHERSVDGPTQAFGATSATAISLEVGLTKIEAYARTSSLEVRANGNVVTLPEGLAVDAGNGVSLIRNGNILTVDGPGILLDVVGRGQTGFIPHIDLRAYTDEGTLLTGLLGSSDGEAANDLTASDGTVITRAVARAHDTAFYGFTDSWRITNPAQSPFTLPSSTFDDPNEPRPSSEQLAPYRAQALTLLGAATSICSGDFELGEYIVDVLAIELAIGTAISDLSRYTCGYEVTGRVTTTGPAGGTLGVHGAKVTVDAVGLRPCVTTAAPDGSYVCATGPDFDEVGDGSGISFPLAFDIDVSAPAGTTTVATASGSFASAPVFGATARSVDNDPTVAPADLTIVDLSGSISIFGEPRTTQTSFDLEYEDGAGVDLGSRTRAITPDASGDYREAFVIPQTASLVTVTWDKGIGDEARPTTMLSSFTAGVNARTFDPAYDPPVAEVSGTALINGTVPFQVLVSVEGTLGDGSTILRQVVAEPDQTTGMYATERVLPNDTTSFVATVEVLDQELITRSATVDPATAGSNPVTLDLTAVLPILAVSGTALENGAPITEATVFTVEATRSSGATVTTTHDVTPASNGSYSLAVDLPDDATSATVTAATGPTAADHRSVLLTTIEAGTNAVTFDFDATFPVLMVSGVLTSGGQPYLQDIPVRVTATAPQAFDEIVVANPTSDGSYSFTIAMPGGTTAAELTAELGFGPADHVVAPLTGLTAGDNNITLDASFDAVVLELSGVLTDRSAPASGFTRLDFQPFDGTGAALAPQSQTVVGDETGAYDELIYLPEGTAEVLIADRIGELIEGRIHQRITGLAAGSNPATYSNDHNPPVLDITGAFTGNGTPLAGLYDIVADANFTDEHGNAGSFTVRDQVFLSIVDGSYTVDLTLPEATTAATLTAEIGADPAFFPTLVVDPVNAGDNPVDFTADLTQDVDIQLTVNLSVDGDPFSDPTDIVYRAFDADDIQIGADVEVEVNPGTVGTDTVSMELSPDARRLEVAWVATPGPTFQSFAVVPGLNLVDYAADIQDVDVNISGRLTDDGVPFTDPTQIRLRARESRIGSTVSNEIIDVVPDGNGEYQFSRELDPTVTAIELQWLDAFAADPTVYDVVRGINDIVFDDDVGTIGAQTFELTGTITIDGDPWPEDFDIVLRPRTVPGATFPVPNTVTPDQTTGAYTVTYVAPEPITEVRVLAEGVDSTFPVGPIGTTTVDLDFALDGQLVQAAGTIVDGAAPATSGRVVLADASDTSVRFTRFPTLDGNGDYEVSFRTLVDITSALLGVADGRFDDDVRFDQTAVALSGGVTSLADVDFDVAAPILDVSGTLTNDGSPVTDPVTFTVTWTDDEPDLRSTWTSTVAATPDGNGDYSLSIDGPLRADRALIVADVAAPLVDRSVEVTGLVNGSNSATLSVAFGASELVISGTVLDGGQPATDGPYPLTITSIDGSGASLGSSTVDITPDSGDGTYSVTVPVPATAADATLEVDLTDYDFATEANPALVFTQASGPLDADGSTDVTFDVSTTFLEVTGTVSTIGGSLRTDEFFTATVQALDGTTELAVVDVDEAFTGFSTAAYTIGVHLPAGTDNAVVQVDFAGAAPIAVGGINPGLTAHSADITTDEFQSMTVTGRLAVDGANPTGFVDLQLVGFRTDTFAAGHQLQEAWYDSPNFSYSASDGTGSVTVLVPPEVELVELQIGIPPDFNTYRRVTDLRGGPGPHTFAVDIDITSDLIQISGTAAVTGNPAIGPCAREGEPFLFIGTITGFTGDPADIGTPPGTELVNTMVVTSLDPTSVGGVLRNWDLTASVPAGVTHIQASYTTVGVEDPNDAQLTVTRDAVTYGGGAVNIVDNLIAACNQ